MNRHVLIGRFGAKDKVVVPIDPREKASELEFVKANKRFDHGVGDALHDLKALDIYPSEIGVYLLIVGAQVFQKRTTLPTQGSLAHLNRKIVGHGRCGSSFPWAPQKSGIKQLRSCRRC